MPLRCCRCLHWKRPKRSDVIPGSVLFPRADNGFGSGSNAFVSKPPNFDLFVSYSREDEQRGQIFEIVARIEKEYRDFTGGGELRVCFDKSETRKPKSSRVSNGRGWSST